MTNLRLLLSRRKSEGDGACSSSAAPEPEAEAEKELLFRLLPVKLSRRIVI